MIQNLLTNVKRSANLKIENRIRKNKTNFNQLHLDNRISTTITAIFPGQSIAKTSTKRSERTNRWNWEGEVVLHTVTSKTKERKSQMKTSQFKDYSELPLFLNAEIIAKVLGISL